MAGVTDLAYRVLARECGADFTVTEFTAASGLTRKNTYSWLKVESDPRESPFIPQIFGGITEEMVKTVEMLQDRADAIDINFGCPAPKVCKNDAGAALLRDPDRVVEMVRSCIEVAEVPITVKMRLGTGSGPNTALEICQRLEAEGVERICVHGRTLRQRYSGEADWSEIREIVDSVGIPVIANGDVTDSSSASECLEATTAHGLMIGRGAIGRPSIFYEIKRDLGWPFTFHFPLTSLNKNMPTLFLHLIHAYIHTYTPNPHKHRWIYELLLLILLFSSSLHCVSFSTSRLDGIE